MNTHIKNILVASVFAWASMFGPPAKHHPNKAYRERRRAKNTAARQSRRKNRAK